MQNFTLKPSIMHFVIKSHSNPLQMGILFFFILAWLSRYEKRSCISKALQTTGTCGDFSTRSRKTPSLRWNNCLCSLWTYSHSSVALFVCIPNRSPACIYCLGCRPIEEEIVVIPKIISHFYPIWLGTKYTEVIHSQDEKQCLYFKCSKDIFEAGI